MFGALIRTVFAALLYELSLVVRPAYPEAQVEARSWSPAARIAVIPLYQPPAAARWR